MYARLLLRSTRVVAGGFGLLLGLPAQHAGAQWTIAMRVMRTPVPVGQCSYVEIVVTDAQGRTGPGRPDGKQVSGWDFDFSVVSEAPDAFRLQNDDPTRPFICAQMPTAPSATFIAHYPGRQLKPNQVVPGVEMRQSIEVVMEGAGAPVSGYPQAPGYPEPNGYQQPTGSQPNEYSQGVETNAAPSALPMAAATPTAPDSGVRTGTQFIQRITGHAKRKASEVATNTTTGVADATGDVIGTTLEAGGSVVKSGAAAVTGAASEEVEGVGRALGATSEPKDPADVAAALVEGRAVLRGLRFSEGTAILDPSSGPLISQIAGAMARTPGQFLIEAHVDGKHGAPAQALSEQRAAAVKAALVAAGSSPLQLAAVGYGASRPVAGARSSARIEITRTH